MNSEQFHQLKTKDIVARRKELKNIASGLYGSFVSRNNDVDGFWGIGKLCLFAQQHGAGVIIIDLLSVSIEPANSEFSGLSMGYHSALQKHLSSRCIPASFLSKATIEIDFNPQQPSGKAVPITSWGNLFKLTVAIVDDFKKVHMVVGYGYCAPHNPSKESRSTRPVQ